MHDFMPMYIPTYVGTDIHTQIYDCTCTSIIIDCLDVLYIYHSKLLGRTPKRLSRMGVEGISVLQHEA